MWKIKLQKMVGNLLDQLRKLYMSWNGNLEILSRPHVIENSRQYLLLRTDILQRPVVGCPWIVKLYALFKTRDPTNHILFRLAPRTRLGQIMKGLPPGPGRAEKNVRICLLKLKTKQSPKWKFLWRRVHLSSKILCVSGVYWQNQQ